MKFASRAGAYVLAAVLVATTLYTHGTIAATDIPTWIGAADTIEMEIDGEVGDIGGCRQQAISVITMASNLVGSEIRDGDACVFEGSRLDVAARYSVDGTTQQGAAIRLDGGNFTPVSGLYGGLIYTPATDIITYRDASYARELYAVENASLKMEPLYRNAFGEVIMYAVRPGAAEQLFKRQLSTTSQYHMVYSYALSPNGKYLAAYLDYRAFALLSLDTNEVKVIKEVMSAEYYQYRPYVTAVSNDGRYVITGGGVNIIDTASCSNSLAIYESSGPILPCLDQDYSYRLAQEIGYAPHVTAAKFSNSNLRLELDTLNIYGGGVPKHITLTLQGESAMPAPRLEYLALGDSYSSGEGDIEGSPYIKATDSIQGCHLSYKSYPYVLRDVWLIENDKMESVACSGAQVLPDYYGSSNYFGQSGKLYEKSDSELEQVRQEALQEFTPGILRQIDFVEKYQPEKVTFTAGGNDVGFADILKYCASSYFILADETCAWVGKQQRADLNRKIDDTYDYISIFVKKLKEASPTTKIYIIGYPQFISNGLLCKNSSPLLNGHERAMIRESLTRMNNISKKVARDTGVYYVDIEDSLAGGQICDGSAYMTGPLKLDLNKLLDNNVQESYHPNSKGHAKIASAIATKIQNGMDYDIIDIPDETDGRKIIRKAVLPNYAGVGSTHTVVVEGGVFGPNSTARGDMFSKPTYLGSATTAADGALKMTITIPTGVGYGTHLLQIEGVDELGEPIVLQQYVDVISGITGDVDGDGIPDDDDRCFAVSEWYEEGVNICGYHGRVVVSTQQSSAMSSVAKSEARTDSYLFAATTIRDAEQSPYFAPDRVTDNVLFDTNHVSGTTGRKESKPETWWIFAIPIILSVGVAIYYAKQKAQKNK